VKLNVVPTRLKLLMSGGSTVMLIEQVTGGVCPSEKVTRTMLVPREKFVVKERLTRLVLALIGTVSVLTTAPFEFPGEGQRVAVGIAHPDQ